MYAGLAILFFFLFIFLQEVAGYSALEAGLTTMPSTLIMFVLSRRMGALADRHGPRLFMAVGPLVAAAGILLFLRVGIETSYLYDLLPALIVFSLGLAMIVAPLTATVLADADESDAGIASAINNAIARVAGLIGISAIGAVVAGEADRRHIRSERRVGARVSRGDRDLRGARRGRRHRRRVRDPEPQAASSRRGLCRDGPAAGAPRPALISERRLTLEKGAARG